MAQFDEFGDTVSNNGTVAGDSSEAGGTGPQGSGGFEWRGERPGYDELTAAVDETMGEAAGGVLRDMLNQTRAGNAEVKDMQARLSASIADVERIRAGAAPTEEPAEKIYTDDQKDVVSAVLRDAGVVTGDELETKNAEAETGRLVADALRQGVEEYGEAFGTISPSGTVTINPDLRENLRPIMDRVDEHGVTPLDLVKIMGMALPEKEAAPSPVGRSNINRANVISRSAGSPNRNVRPDIRSKNGDWESTLDKAFALAQQDVGAGLI